MSPHARSGDELTEALAVVQRRPVPETDNRGFERGKTASRLEVLAWIRRERFGWELQPRATGRNPEPEDDHRRGPVLEGVTGNLKHRESGDAIALLERVTHGMARTRDQPVLDTPGKGRVLQAVPAPDSTTGTSASPQISGRSSASQISCAAPM